MRSNTNPRRRQRRARAQEGAALLIVMLVLLAVTATALFAVHMTTYEIRASGHGRVAAQAYYVADTGLTSGLAWVDERGPAALLRIAREAELSGEALDLSPFEPSVAAGRAAHRLDADDLLVLGAAPIDREGLGPRQIYEPRFVIDVYDIYSYSGVQAGHRADGQDSMRYLRATYTARGRLGISGEAVPSGDVRDARDARDYHEGARDMRANALSGPFGGGG